jgi:hypothetical protein
MHVWKLGAKTLIHSMAFTAAMKRCATQNPKSEFLLGCFGVRYELSPTKLRAAPDWVIQR